MFIVYYLIFYANFALATAILSQELFQQQNNRLFNDLFGEYHKEMSPYNGHGMVNDTYPLTPVTISLQYARLIRVLEPELQHQNMVGLLLNWQDPRLRWDPSLYGGIDHIYVNQFAVWIPEFYPCESSQASIVSMDQSLSIGVNASGFMNTFIVFSTHFSCEFDVFRFPFDTQNCYYCFVIFNYDAKDELRFDAKFAARPYIYDTSEWALKLHGTHYIESVDTDFKMGVIYYNITFTRRPQFWVGLVITPTFLIGTLIIIGLFFGNDVDIVNNAVGLGLTTMMSMMVIVGILANAFAKSRNIPILGWYVLVEIFLIIAAVFGLMINTQVICDKFHSLVDTACKESKKSWLNSFKSRFFDSLHKWGKYWTFSIFFIAHILNLLVLLQM